MARDRPDVKDSDSEDVSDGEGDPRSGFMPAVLRESDRWIAHTGESCEVVTGEPAVHSQRLQGQVRLSVSLHCVAKRSRTFYFMSRTF